VISGIVLFWGLVFIPASYLGYSQDVGFLHHRYGVYNYETKQFAKAASELQQASADPALGRRGKTIDHPKPTSRIIITEKPSIVDIVTKSMCL
jgi:hypothetical protein